jgi:hypothetical protein
MVEVIKQHAMKDLEYIEGLEAYLDDGNKPSKANVYDLIAMVRWNAETLLGIIND